MAEVFQVFQRNLEKLVSQLVYSLPFELHASMQYLVQGKKIRSNMMYACSEILGVDYKEIVSPAAALEIIHTISLIHDDVIDSNHKRRQYPTLNKLFNREVSIWTGDSMLFHLLHYLMANSSRRLREDLLLKILDLFKGEFFQDNNLSLDNLKQNQSYQPYLDIVRKKTGSLFSMVFTSPGILKNKGAAELLFYEECGYTFGLVYQLLDDCCDLEEDIKTKISHTQFTLPIFIWHSKYANNKNFEKSKITKEVKKNILQDINSIITEECEALALAGKPFIKNRSHAKKIFEYTLKQIKQLQSL